MYLQGTLSTREEEAGSQEHISQMSLVEVEWFWNQWLWFNCSEMCMHSFDSSTSFINEDNYFHLAWISVFSSIYSVLLASCTEAAFSRLYLGEISTELDFFFFFFFSLFFY